MHSQRGRIWAMTIASFIGFFIFGVVDVLKGSTLSAVLDDLQYSYSRGGLIVMAAYFGFVVASLAGGFIADLGGKRTILIVASVAMAIGVIGYASAHSFAMLAGAFLFIGFACGSYEIGSNYIILEVQSAKPGLYVSLLTAFYGVGSMLAPLYAGRMFAAGFGWRDIYLYSVVAPLALLVGIFLCRYPKVDKRLSAGLNWSELKLTAFSPIMCWLYVLNFAYVAGEVGVATWLVEYLRVARGISIEQGTTWLALFYAGIMIGRFIGSVIVDRVGYVKIMVIAVALALACILIGAYGPGALVYLLPVTGLCFSIVLPTATALVSTLGLPNMGSILGLFFCFVGFGGMGGPWLSGVVSDWLGVKAGMMVPAAFCIVMLVSLGFIRSGVKKLRNRQS